MEARQKEAEKNALRRRKGSKERQKRELGREGSLRLSKAAEGAKCWWC